MPHTSNPGHLTKHFNTQICEAFSMDLRKHNEDGISDHESAANSQWLRDVTDAAAAIPDAELRGKRIRQRYEAMAEAYDRWNARNGTPVLRARHHRRLSRKIDKLVDTYRRRTAMLEQKADPALYRAFYEATEKLLQATPNIWFAVLQRFAKYPKPS
jgi:TPP-dependent pyruvate/acetoin dehydrogenase alpha subunit